MSSEVEVRLLDYAGLFYWKLSGEVKKSVAFALFDSFALFPFSYKFRDFSRPIEARASDEVWCGSRPNEKEGWRDEFRRFRSIFAIPQAGRTIKVLQHSFSSIKILPPSIAHFFFKAFPNSFCKSTILIPGSKSSSQESFRRVSSNLARFD